MRFAPVLAILLLAPLAAGQLPEPSWALALGAALPDEARPDRAIDLAFHANLTAEGAVCPEDAEVPIVFEVEARAPVDGVLLEVPARTAVTVPRGAYPAAEPFAGGAPVPARLLVARFADQGATAEFEVRASADVAAAGCLPASSGPAEVLATVRTRVAVLPPSDPLHHPSHEEHGGVLFDAYLAPGESFAFAFESPGWYAYHDHLDPERKGVVQVLRSATGTAAEVAVTPAGYEPEKVTVGVNGTVTWTNRDDSTRTVSLDESHGAVDLEPEADREVAQVRSNEAESASPAWALVAAALAGSAALARRVRGAR